MSAPDQVIMQSRLEALRTEMAELAFRLERQGRRDAADVVMQLDGRLRELVEEPAPAQTAGAAGYFP